jgi:membrane-bound lytic murein transglycosylase D
MAGLRRGIEACGLLALLGVAAWGIRGLDRLPEPAPMDVLVEEGVVDDAAMHTFQAPVLAPRSRQTWDLTETHNERVQFWIDFLQGRNKDRTHVWLEREGRYGALIRSRLRERGMPEDLFYLAMIESGLSTRAYSHAHASGIWQFIAETGRRYGLEVSTYVDERRDPVKSTDAALDYLSDLYDRFGSWYLAAAGYNSGENRVERILRQRAGGEKGDDALYWRIAPYLPRETRDYVPLMLAAGYIGKDPNGHGFHGLEHQAPLAFDLVEVDGGISLAAIAKAAGVEGSLVTDLNPQLVRGVTPPGRNWEVRVPAGRRAAVVAALDEVLAGQGSTGQGSTGQGSTVVVHRVARGETLSHVARRHGVGVEALRAANPGVNPRRLQVGQSVQVPMGGSVQLASSAGSSQPSWTVYRVRRGDTLSHIAVRHGVTVGQLRQWNGIGTRIYAGQRLRIQA